MYIVEHKEDYFITKNHSLKSCYKYYLECSEYKEQIGFNWNYIYKRNCQLCNKRRAFYFEEFDKKVFGEIIKRGN